MTIFQALTWETRDVDDEHLISIFGRTEDGKSVCVTTPFKPYFFIKLSKTASEQSVRNIYDKLSDLVESYDLVRKRDVWGFQNNEKVGFMKLNFTCLKNMKKCDYRLRRPLKDDTFPQKVYEANIDPVLRFMHRTDIQSSGWLEVTDCVRSHLSRVQLDLFCNDWKTLKSVKRDDIAPFIVASFDIESYSSTGKFPDPDVPGDAMFQVAFTLRRQGQDEIFDKTCLCFKKTSELTDGSNIISYDTEYDLLMGMREYIIKNDIDMMTGWNIFGFDLEFIYKRAILNKCPPEFFHLGKLKNITSEMVYKRLSSSALGDNILKILPMSGRFIFDLFQEVKKDQKLDSYALNAVSEKFVGDKKIDMPS